MKTLNASLSMLRNTAILQYLMKGVLFTLIISVIAVVFGLLIGSILALVRNYCHTGKNKIFRYLATFYIELFRNTPLLLWIFICLVFCPTPWFLNRKMFGLNSAADVKLLFKGAVALILFTSSVIAEIVRGGLNSVAEGQFEAGYSQGFNTVQVMVYIILPQAYRNIIPTLLSQVITTIKDSSYLANVAVIELMARTKQIMSSANRYNGTGVINVSDVFVLFGFAFLIYFIINFTLSCVVRHMQKRMKEGAKKPADIVAVEQ
ncbi:MAG: amino acid ABC transporter permease [Lachnospiraceae bacterium]|nr:amino acid ABC transporter permease [Lachnospiraceae bacterium]